MRAELVVVLVPSLYVLAGAIAYAMLYSFVAPAGRRDAPALHAFATTCLAAALAALFAGRMLQATSDAEFLRELKSNLDCLILTALGFSVFVTRYARLNGRSSRGAFAAYAAVALVLIAMNETLPGGLQYERFDGIARLTLPWHEIVARGRGRHGPLMYVALVAIEGVIPYAVVVLLSVYRRRRDRSALWMLASLATLVPFAVQGALVRLSIVHGVPTGPFGILTVVAVIGATLAQETRRKLLDSEGRLRESEIRLRTLIGQSPIAISFSRDGVTLEVNARYLDMFGYTSAAEVCATPLLQRIAPSHRAEMQELVARRQAGLPAPMSYETMGLRKDGGEFPLFVSARRIELADGPLTMSFLMDFTERKKAEERIRQLALFDQLTLLPNRELLQDRLNQALAASARTGRYGALLLLNLDDFKRVNDTLGHAAGDALLQQAAAKLAAEVRSGDTLARGDGDEFAVLLEDLATQPLAAAGQAKAFGLQMMQALSGSYTLSDGSVHVSCSVGATILAGRRQSREDLIKQANIALHQAKKAGRNVLRFFDPRMQESVSARAALEGELRNAIAAAQFVLHYQLQVDDSGTEIGAEALLRWNHPERGLVSPAEFIALAEETHMIVPIGEWIIDAACAQLAAWSRMQRSSGLSLAVNVSSLQFQQPEFAVQVLGCIRHHAIDARRLKLEVTETMLQEDLERTVSAMNILKAEGVQFALDDFGTGYSSLQYLKRLPLDQLKIDRSFVRDIASDPNDRAIVSTIVAIARHLGLDVMAEGVETREQLEVLRECGCNRYQGYLFGQPWPAGRLFQDEDALTSS